MSLAFKELVSQAPKPNIFRRFTGKVSQTAKSAMEKTGVSKALGKASRKLSQAKTRIATQWDPVAKQKRLQQSIAKEIEEVKKQGQILSAKAEQATKDLATSEAAQAAKTAAQEEYKLAKAAIIQQAQAAKAARKAAQAGTVSVAAPAQPRLDVGSVHASFTGGARKRTSKYNNKKRTKHNIISRKYRK